jgi:Flp pilus assembly pilin Flp
MLEYTLLLGAIIAVVVMILIGTPAGGGTNLKKKVQDTYGKFGTALENTTNDLTGGVFKKQAGDQPN